MAAFRTLQKHCLQRLYSLATIALTQSCLSYSDEFT